MSGFKLARSNLSMRRKLTTALGIGVMAASVVAFIAYIAVAGLGKANELAGVVSALVALGGLGLAVGGLAWGTAPKTGRPIVKEAVGSPPWTIEGHGITYKVLNSTCTTRMHQGVRRRMIVVTACVTRTQSSGMSYLEYRFRDEESGKKLNKVDSEGSVRKNPALYQPSKLVIILEDLDLPVKSMIISLRDFFALDGHDLILHKVPIL